MQIKKKLYYTMYLYIAPQRMLLHLPVHFHFHGYYTTFYKSIASFGCLAMVGQFSRPTLLQYWESMVPEFRIGSCWLNNLYRMYSKDFSLKLSVIEKWRNLMHILSTLPKNTIGLSSLEIWFFFLTNIIKNIFKCSVGQNFTSKK